ncbi:MAG TPA: FecR domain-containing protein [Rhizomicrobium sp.]
MTDQLDPLARQSLAWVDLLTSGLATEADATAFEDWRMRSPAHARALRAAVSLRRSFSEMRGEERTPVSSDTAHSAMIAQSVLARRAFLGMGAVAVSAYVAVSPPLDLWPGLAEWAADYRTGKGERRHLAFADGISIEMNTLTSLAHKANSSVDLIEGEVAVTAHRTGATPFEISTPGGRVLASLAQFDMRRDHDMVSVNCVSGEVRVEAGKGICNLRAGHRVSYGNHGLEVEQKFDVAAVMAWRTGRLVFRDTLLSDAISEINRYREGRIVVASSRLGARRINAVFQIAEIRDVAALIHRLTGAQITSVGNYVVLT